MRVTSYRSLFSNRICGQTRTSANIRYKERSERTDVYFIGTCCFSDLCKEASMWSYVIDCLYLSVRSSNLLKYELVSVWSVFLWGNENLVHSESNEREISNNDFWFLYTNTNSIRKEIFNIYESKEWKVASVLSKLFLNLDEFNNRSNHIFSHFINRLSNADHEYLICIKSHEFLLEFHFAI